MVETLLGLTREPERLQVDMSGTPVDGSLAALATKWRGASGAPSLASPTPIVKP